MTFPRIQLRQGLALAAVLFILTIWLAMFATFENVRREAYQQAVFTANKLADAYAWQIHREVQAIDQTLRSVAAEWAEDPSHFDPRAEPIRSLLLRDVAEQISIIDKTGRVISSSQAKLVGRNWQDQPFFTALQNAPTQLAYIGGIQRDLISARPVMGFAIRLPDPDGKFVGVLLANIDMRDLAAKLGDTDLGANGLAALIGPGPVTFRLFDDRPNNAETSIQGTKMWQTALADPNGLWLGPSAPDGQLRLHAFRRLSPAEPGFVVGLDYDIVMQPAAVWRRQAVLFGLGLTCLTIAAFGLLLRQFENARDREEQVAREREKLAAAYQALAIAHAHADAKSNELSATITGMSDGIMMLDGDLHLMQWNQHYPEIDGVPREVLRVGMSMEEILRVQVRAGEFGMVDEDAEVERRMAIFRSPNTQTGTIERTRPDMRTVESRRSALDGGGFVTLYTDITARKQAQALQEEARRLAEQMAEAKSRFVATVSHEIRTPLNAVLNALTLLSDTDLQPAQQNLTDRAAQAGEALLHLLTDILEMSKMEAGELALRPEVFALRPLLEGVQEMFEDPAKERGMILSVDTDPTGQGRPAPERLRADPGRLRQILMNLVSNAVKYAGPGAVKIIAESHMVFGRTSLRLAVRDSGPAIASADARRLFQPFVRLENAAYARSGGTGLGLAICHRLAGLMGGKIGLRAIDGGNEFWITVPIEAAGAGVITWSAPKPPVERSRPTRRHAIGRAKNPPRTRILLVEDLPANQVITATMLRREGHKLDVARSGAEAIAMVSAALYDVVLMDVSMPGMSGLDAARRIRALPEPACSLPIIAVTANASPQDRAACLSAGMSDLLAKPASAETLQAAILREVWSGRRAPQPMLSTDARLDIDRINEIRTHLPASAFAAIVETCLSDLHKLMPELRRALSVGAAGEVKDLAHAMAGVAGMYGLSGVQQKLRSVLHTSRGDGAEVANDIEAELVQTTEIVRAFVLAQAA